MLTHEDVQRLYELVKLIKDKEFNFPELGQRNLLNAKSKNSNDEFIFNITRGYSNPNKCSYTIRTIENDVLFRVDIGGAPHRNPNGQEVPCPHLHVYQYDGTSFFENWAFPLEDEIITNSEDLIKVFLDFLEYNKVENLPIIIQKIEFE